MAHSVEGSLRRLRTDYIDVFLLHSPSVDQLRECDAGPTLDKLVKAGKLKAWGVSCDDLPGFAAALDTESVAVVQLPLAVTLAPEANSLLETAARRGVGLLIRELGYLGGLADAAARRRALAAALRLPSAVALIGTTRPAHLLEVVADVGTLMPSQHEEIRSENVT